MKDILSAEVLQFWFEDIEHSCWFNKDPEFEQQLKERCDEALKQARAGKLDQWHATAEGYGSDKYALNHLELIERFVRFPHRNEVLGRECTREEQDNLDAGNAGF